MESSAIAEDVWRFLQNSMPGNDKKLIALKRNLPAAFADASCCACIIHNHFPRLISLHNYPESSSMQGRTANWQLLNKKALKKLHFDINAQLIDVFVNRKSSEQAQTFLRMLRAKMIAYEPIYATLAFTDAEEDEPSVFEKLNKLASAPPPPAAQPLRRSSVISSNTATSAAPGGAASTVARKTSVSFSLSSTSSSKAIAKTSQQTVPPQHRPSMAVTNSIAQKLRSREEVSRRASMMTEEEMDSMYRQFSMSLVVATEMESGKVASVEEKVAEIDKKFNELRTENIEALKKVERRLSALKSEPVFEVFPSSKPSSYSDEDDVEGDVYAQREGSKASSVSNKRSTLPAAVIASALAYDSDSDSDSSDSVEPPPPPLPASALLKQATTSSSNATTNTTKLAKLSSVSTIKRGSIEKAKTLSASPEAPKLALEVGTSPVPLPRQKAILNEKLYTRVFSLDENDYFFIDENTKRSQWEQPAEGIVASTDDDSGREFFTCVKTGISAWTIDSLVEKREAQSISSCR